VRDQTAVPRKFRAALLGAALCLAAPAVWAEDAPGVTGTEITLGQTQPYSGAAGIFGAVGKAEQAYFKMIDDQGGVNGRKIVLLSRDDGYDPSRTVELTKRLVETDKVAAIFSIQGASQNLAIRDYLNTHGIPQLFTVTGADIAGDFRHYPWTIGWAPSYFIEAHAFAARSGASGRTARSRSCTRTPIWGATRSPERPRSATGSPPSAGACRGTRQSSP